MSIRLIDGSEFLHIPKTGGTWVRQILESQGLVKDVYVGGHEHADYDRVVYGARQPQRPSKPVRWMRSISRRTLGHTPQPKPVELGPTQEPEKVFRFCFVRHPLTWYESWWRYMESRGWNDWGDPDVAGGWHPNHTLNGLGSSDFNQFVQNVIDARPGYVSELFYSYAKPGICFIGKTESLADDLLSVLKHLGHSVDTQAVKQRGPANASKNSQPSIAWDPVLRQTLLRLELPALVHFGYLDEQTAQTIGLPTTLQPASVLQHLAAT